MGKHRYFRQLDPKSYLIQGVPGQLFLGLRAAIPAVAALGLGLDRGPESVNFRGPAAAGAAVFMVLIRAAAAVGPGAAG
jgi:hypothetical protein